MKKVVFLDIDGVLNSQQWAETRGSRVRNPTYADDVQHSTDPACIARLNMITEVTDAVVVLSSTWRTFHTWEDTANALRDRRGMTGAMIGRTPIPSEHDPDVFARYAGRRPHPQEPYPRGYEIQQWLDSADDVAAFVILDDDDDMEHLSPWHVQTDFATGGLQIGHVRRAIELLNVQRRNPRRARR